MNLRFKPGRLRRSAALAYCALLCYLGYRLLGNSGLGLVLLGAHAWWRRAWSAPVEFVPRGELVSYWRTEFAVACKFRGAPWQWVWLDEVSRAEFAELRRYARARSVEVGISR